MEKVEKRIPDYLMRMIRENSDPWVCMDCGDPHPNGGRGPCWTCGSDNVHKMSVPGLEHVLRVQGVPASSTIGSRVGAGGKQYAQERKGEAS